MGAIVVLGLVQGLCEFLPISSSGHLVLLSRWLGVQDSLFISIVLHLATLLAVVVVMRKEVWGLVRHPFSKQGIMLMLATICTCLIAIVLMPLISSSFEGAFLPIAFLITAILLFIVGRFVKKTKVQKEFGYKQAVIMGIVQGFAIFPGISRSGATISAGLFSGAGREESAKFSFILSLPVIICSLIMEIIKIFLFKQPISVNWPGLLLAFIVAFVVGIASIKFMLKITGRGNFAGFSIYLLIISILSFIF